MRDRFRASFDALAAIGRNAATGGYNRFAWTHEDRAARDWFAGEAERAGSRLIEQDANGNLWAWFGPAGDGAVVTGSHLDTVPEGGAYDGALGVVAGLLAVESVLSAGRALRRPLAVVAFADEEGARFGVATFGSRLLTGSLDPADVLDRTDAGGTTVREALASFGVDAGGLGADPDRVNRLSWFVELHVEQGRGLDELGAAVGVATAIWPHGRWRLTVTGEANHAGTTRLVDRRDPMLVVAAAINSARAAAHEVGGLATVGKVVVEPNGTNVIPSRADAWLDARAGSEEQLGALVQRWRATVESAAVGKGLGTTIQLESSTGAVPFDASLRGRIRGVLQGAPELSTGAGHDAGALAEVVPTAMLFVRNPTGVSHSPAESASDDDCVAGIIALAAVLQDLACRP